MIWNKLNKKQTGKWFLLNLFMLFWSLTNWTKNKQESCFCWTKIERKTNTKVVFVEFVYVVFWSYPGEHMNILNFESSSLKTSSYEIWNFKLRNAFILIRLSFTNLKPWNTIKTENVVAPWKLTECICWYFLKWIFKSFCLWMIRWILSIDFSNFVF